MKWFGKIIIRAAVQSSNFIVDIDTAVLALGYWPDPVIGESTPNLKTQKYGLIVVDAATGATSRPGVYAGGDDVTGPINLGNPAEYSMRELAEKIVSLVGSKSPIDFRPLPQDDPMKRKPDIRLAQEVLGWAPSVQLEAGLMKSIEYFDSALRKN